MLVNYSFQNGHNLCKGQPWASNPQDIKIKSGPRHVRKSISSHHLHVVGKDVPEINALLLDFKSNSYYG
jgi:hypothetical protein